MFRSQVIAGILSVCGFLAWTEGAMAEEPKAPKPPDGITISYTGDSYHHLVPETVDACVKAAGIAGHKKVQVLGVRGGYLGRLDNDSPVAIATRKVLKDGVDVHVHSHHWAQFTPFTLKLGLEGNPNFRFYHTMSWLPQTAGKPLPEAATITEKHQKSCEVEADKVNKMSGKQVAFLIPTSQAVMKARLLIADGKLPGVKKDIEMFTGTEAKPDGHPSVITGVLNGYCTFAAVYRTSPVGLKIEVGGLPAELHAELQKIAWDTVSKYTYAGIAKAPAIGQAPPAGVRISIDGNSWSVWPSLSLPLAKEAGIEGQIDERPTKDCSINNFPIAAIHPGGVAAISRWLSEATPPEGVRVS